ncbi:transcription factor s-ii (tfiis), central domain-containing protein [Besnoitia besnoiti]|uniref:Transcription factor s-ii (Tfiis), central domain-containing protein n=1 Tax=Besnoitia besnoiti TaxID=94643 RepID=A0A2A9MGB1_BESBE|nr:transcription factor s-ii (tfiis), central domain-containing protein [Besnoitia besnoiti]PFH35311.1 transcription factor s-ii (tfiis), central domain-containing protein [Besnoitia besnoiti]
MQTEAPSSVHFVAGQAQLPLQYVARSSSPPMIPGGLAAGPSIPGQPAAVSLQAPYAAPQQLEVPMLGSQNYGCQVAPARELLPPGFRPERDLPPAESGGTDGPEVEDLTGPTLEAPESPSSPPSPGEVAGSGRGARSPPVCLFQLAGETFYLGDWVRLKSSGERDWVAQIVAYFPGSDASDLGDGAEDADGESGGGGRILCRWGWDPRDLRKEACPALPLQSYSRFEVIPAINFCDENPIQSIKAKVRVERYEKWRLRTSYPPLVRCAADEEDEEKHAARESAGAASAPEEAGRAGMPSVLFFRHCHEIETGFHPSLLADVYRFKGISRSLSAAAASPTTGDSPIPQLPSPGSAAEFPGGVAKAPVIDLCAEEGEQGSALATGSGVPEGGGSRSAVPAYRRYQCARNPDVRHFFCCHCQSTFAPPDDISPPAWPEGEAGGGPGSHGPAASYHPALVAPAGGTSPPLPELELLPLAEFLQSTDEAPVRVLAPAQLPFVWRRFPAEGDFTILCWKCKGKRRRKREGVTEKLKPRRESETPRAERKSGVVSRRKRRDDSADEVDAAGGDARRGGASGGEKGPRSESQQRDAGRLLKKTLSERQDKEEGSPSRAQKRRREAEGEAATGSASENARSGDDTDAEKTTQESRKRQDGTEAERGRKRRKAARGVARAAAAAMAAEASSSSDAGQKEDSDGDFVAESDEESGGEGVQPEHAPTEDRDHEKSKRPVRQGGSTGHADGLSAPFLSRKVRKDGGMTNGASTAGASTAGASTAGASAATASGSRVKASAATSSRRPSSGAAASSVAASAGVPRKPASTDWHAGNQARVDRLAEAFRLGIRELAQEAKAAAAGAGRAKASATPGAAAKEEVAPVVKVQDDGGAAAESRTGDSASSESTDGGAKASETEDPVARMLRGLRFSTGEACAKAVNAAFMSQHRTLNSRRQKQRFFELLSNLKRENNQELRKKVLTGQISVNRLVTMESAELAPSFVRKEREEERERHFRQAVLLHETPVTALARLRKTHKGIEPVLEDSDFLQSSPPASEPAPPVIAVEKGRQGKAKHKRERVRLHESGSSSSSGGSSDSSDGATSDGEESGSGTSSSSYDSSDDSASSSSDSDFGGDSSPSRKRAEGGGADESGGGVVGASGPATDAPEGSQDAAAACRVQEQLASLKRLFSQAAPGVGASPGSEDHGAGGDGVSVQSETSAGDAKGSEGGGERGASQRPRQPRERRVVFAGQTRSADGGGGKGISTKSRRRRHLLAHTSASGAPGAAVPHLPRLPELLPNQAAGDESPQQRGGGGKEAGRKDPAGARGGRQSSASTNLGVPLDCSTFSPEACKERVRQLLESVPAVGTQAPPARATPLLDYRAVVGSMLRYLNVALDRVTAEVHRR